MNVHLLSRYAEEERRQVALRLELLVWKSFRVNTTWTCLASVGWEALRHCRCWAFFHFSPGFWLTKATSRLEVQSPPPLALAQTWHHPTACICGGNEHFKRLVCVCVRMFLNWEAKKHDVFKNTHICADMAIYMQFKSGNIWNNNKFYGLWVVDSPFLKHKIMQEQATKKILHHN